jgi:subtilisin family serine protease
MIGKVVISILSVIALSAQAETTRYLVKFKSQSTFNSMVTEMRHSAPSIFMNPHVNNFRLFSQTTKSTEALENIGLLIVESEEGVAGLKTNSEVEFVEKEVFHPAPEPIGTMSIGSGLSAASSSEPIPMPWGIKSVKAPAAWVTTKGENIKVMVLDTGVDKDHPAIRDRFLKGRNLVGDAQAKDDVTDGIGHGTHVSGTILASGDAGGLVGVAPRARLLMGRVCATRGCSSVAIASGVEWGIQENVQVISLSLGGAFATSGEMQAFAAAEQAGVFVVAASGNESATTVDYPGALPSVLAVGAVDATQTRAAFSNYGPELGVVAPGVDTYSSVPRGMGRTAVATANSAKITSSAFQGSPKGLADNIQLVDCNLGTTADCQGSVVAGKIALIARGGGISFGDKAKNAIAAGAAAVLIYNNTDVAVHGAVSTDGTEIAIPAVLINKTDGEALKASLVGKKVVRATVGVVASDYDTYQGTSMATPHVAGVAALIRAANPSLSPSQVRDVMKATATPLGPNDSNQYGAGLVNADAAVKKALVTQGLVIPVANGF